MYKFFMLALLAAAMAGPAAAGPFAPAAGQPGSTAIARTDPAITGWARAFVNYQPGTDVDGTFQTPAEALGPAEGTNFDIVALGNGGRITLTFGGTLFDGPGWDFAVFENSFSDTFLELAFVEVSSDGANFFRLPNFSFTPAPLNAFGNIDPTNIDGYAGKYRAGFGTPFDLNVFSGAAGIDVNRITHVRLVDIVGDGTAFDNFPATYGGPHPIYDPHRTVGSAGFDLDGVAVRHLNAASPVPLPSALGLFALASAALAARRRRNA